MPVITFAKESFFDLEGITSKEWLITNGLGGYASSTISGINTRKYHGLLVGALHPPIDRTVFLSKLDEDVIIEDKTFRLGSNQFMDTIYPQGYQLINSFSISPYPKYVYEIENITIEKKIFMPKNKNAVSIIYRIVNRTDSDVSMRLFPLLTCRHFHTVKNRSNPLSIFRTETNSREFQIDFLNPHVSLICYSTDGEFKEAENRIEKLFYQEDWTRGESYLDDCFQIGFFELQVLAQTEKEFAVNATIHEVSLIAKEVMLSLGSSISEIKTSYNQEVTKKNALFSEFYSSNIKTSMNDWLNWILIAADSFIVQNPMNRIGIIAGYHWFESWGRDTFISLPGLMLVTNRFNDAENILQTYIQHCKNGLIPNYFDDKTGNPVYNTVDATLWYVNAVFQYLKYTRNFEFIKNNLWKTLQSIIANHQKGTLFDISMNQNGLLDHGAGLTWMDAKVGTIEITPRKGMAVEIQALWYNTLRIMQLLAHKFGEVDLELEYALRANESKRSFNEKFWNIKKGCLFDVVDSKDIDASIRPNQIFAVSLDFSMLDKDRSFKVVENVTNELATPYGLRTLSPNDPKFVGKYEGDRHTRDVAYHNGAIWPWLLGPYVTAYLKVHDYTLAARNFIFQNHILPLFKKRLNDGGLGTINEIYDSDPPNKPRGCISQAWSIAEPLRAYIEDVLMNKPKTSEKQFTFEN